MFKFFPNTGVEACSSRDHTEAIPHGVCFAILAVRAFVGKALNCATKSVSQPGVWDSLSDHPIGNMRKMPMV